MKIVIVSPLMLAIPDVQGGAIERLMTMLIEENEVHHEQDFYVISIENEEAKRIAQKYKNSKVIYINKVNSFIQKMYYYFLAVVYKLTRKCLPISNLNYIKVMKTIDKIKPDVIVVEGCGGENFYFMSKRYGKEKFYLHLHSEYLPNKILDKTFGNIISVSDYISKKWMKETSNKTLHNYIVKNCIDEQRFQCVVSKDELRFLRERLGYTQDDFVVLFCGRIIKEKGVKELLQAFEKMDNPNIKLLMIGSPNFKLTLETDYLKYVKNKVDQLVNVSWIGYVDNDDLYKYYDAANLLVIPSICEEASPLTALEALTCGVPILATKTGGLPEVVTSECSILIEKDEHLVRNLCEKINYLYLHPQKCEAMHQAALKRAGQFSKERYYYDFIGVFK